MRALIKDILDPKRLPWLYLGVVVFAAVAVAVPAIRPALVYNRSAIAQGELWRIWTGHVVHFGWPHGLADGLKMDRKLVRLLPDNATAHYNLACSLALSKRRSDAMSSLKRAVALGYTDFDWMTQDPDLEDLKDHPEFVRLLDQLKPQS